MASIVFGAIAGNWTDATKWVGGVAPTAADDAQLNGTSANCTIDSGAVCRSLDCTGYTGILTHNSAVALTIGDGTAGLSNVALKLVSTMTYTLGNNASSSITYASTSTTQQTITTGGKTMGNCTFNGASSSYILQDSYSGSSTAFIIINSSPTLNTNGQTVSTAGWTINGASATLTLGASSITCTNTSGAPWNMLSLGTFNANTSTITLLGANAITFTGGGKTYNNVIFTGGAGNKILNNANTFANLTFTGTAVKTCTATISSNQTITGTFTVTGNSLTNRYAFSSNTLGTTRTITAATVSLTNVDFVDITAAGAAAPFTGTSLGDGGGNTSITTDTPVTRYWVGNGGTWSSTTKWSTSSGGSSGASVPLLHDTVVFDSNSITSASQTITADMFRYPAIDFTNVLNSPVFSVSTNLEIYNGNVTFISGMTTLGASTLQMVTHSNVSLITGGITLTCKVQTTAGPSVTITLADDLTTNDTFTHNIGTLTTNSNVTCLTFASSTTNTRTLNMGSGTWTLTGTGTIWNYTNTTGLTHNANTSTIAITNTSSTDKTFVGGQKTYNNLTITGSGTGKVNFTGANTFNVFTINAPKTVRFTAATTTTFTSFVATGTAGNVITISSITAATHTLSMPSLVDVSGDYLDLTNSIGLEANTWYAGANSTDSGGNSGWIFTAVTTTSTSTSTSSSTSTTSTSTSTSTTSTSSSTSTSTSTTTTWPFEIRVERAGIQVETGFRVDEAVYIPY